METGDPLLASLKHAMLDLAELLVLLIPDIL